MSVQSHIVTSVKVTHRYHTAHMVTSNLGMWTYGDLHDSTAQDLKRHQIRVVGTRKISGLGRTSSLGLGCTVQSAVELLALFDLGVESRRRRRLNSRLVF